MPASAPGARLSSGRSTMITKAGGGFQVKSEAGKPLSKPGLTKGAAKARLAQVERMKHLSRWAEKNRSK